MNKKNSAIEIAESIHAAAKVVIKIRRIGGRRWKRNVAKGARIGPWLPAEYDIVDEAAWRSKGACLYLVSANDGVIRYVGISRNGLKHRWRTCPAYDAATTVRLPANQLFHSQCWKYIEAESAAQPGMAYEVRAIAGNMLVPVLARLGPPISAFAALKDDAEGVVASVERWLCNHSSRDLVRWNISMTGTASA